MGKKSKRKRAKRPRRPPLSPLDKFIYCLALLISFAASLLLSYCIDNIRGLIAFRNPSVVAYTNSASHLLVLPFLLYTMASPLIFFATLLTDKKPIFGNKKIKYGDHPWSKDCFPLFDPRRKKVYVSPSQKNLRRKIAAVWCGGLLLFMLIAPLGLFGRRCLYQDNSITSFNMVNTRSTVSYTEEDYSHLTLQTRHVIQYRQGSYWEFEILIEMRDGKEFTFSVHNFNPHGDDAIDKCLSKMTEIKKLFPAERITITGKENVEEAADSIGLNDNQTERLRQLFSL